MIPPGNCEHINFKTHLILRSCDFPLVEFTLSKSAARLSSLIGDILEAEGEDTKIILPLPDIKASILEHIVVYLEYHSNYPVNPISKPLKGPIKDYISKWDYQFLLERFGKQSEETRDIDPKLLNDLIIAANYLNCKSLMELTCATSASIMLALSLEDIRKEFQIENDFTSNEYEKVLEEVKWEGNPE